MNGGGELSSLENRNAKDKIAYAIKQSFKGEFYNHENFSKYVNYVKTCNLLNFKNVKFDKSINLNNANLDSNDNTFMESKYGKVRLGNCGEFIGGLWQGKKPPFVKAKVIRNTNFSMQGALKADSEYPELDVEARQLENRTLNYGDIIIEKSGGSNTQAVGRVVIFNLDSDEIYSFSNFTARLRITRNDINSFYLHLFLNYIYQKGMTFPMQSGMSGLRNLDMHMYKQLQIPIPPLEIQKKIVEECEEVENQANKIKNLIKEYEELIQATLAKAGVTKSNYNLQSIFQNINNLDSNIDSNNEIENLLDSIPTPKNEYGKVKLGEVCEVVDYVSNGSFESLRINVKNSNNKDYAILVRLKDYSNNWNGNYLYTDKKGFDFLKKSSLKVNDVVMCNVGSVGICFKVPDLGQPMTLASNSILIKPIENRMDNNFMFYFFKSETFQILIKSITTSLAQPKFNKTSFRNLQIPLPPLDIQKKIVEVIEKIENKKKSLLDSIQGIEEKMQNILEKYLF